MLSELAVQQVQLPLPIAQRLMDLLTEVRYESVVEAGLQSLQLLVLLDEDIVLQDVENPVDLPAQLAEPAEQGRIVLPGEGRIDDRIRRPALPVVLENSRCNVALGTVQACLDFFPRPLAALGVEGVGLRLRILQPRIEVELR